MLWAAAHGLVMLRLSGIIATDAELRRLHEKTMSSLVRGANQMVAANRGQKSLKLVRSRSTQAKGAKQG
ncbi:MAG TPA: hypothetical protein VN649_17765, partial [Ramlibacter sp.]|nr:hypothetical protein [Ramlibacter sp.]